MICHASLTSPTRHRTEHSSNQAKAMASWREISPLENNSVYREPLSGSKTSFPMAATEHRAAPWVSGYKGTDSGRDQESQTHIVFNHCLRLLGPARIKVIFKDTE